MRKVALGLSLVALLTASGVSAQTWQKPTSAFSPSAIAPSIPLDTGAGEQTKNAKINLKELNFSTLAAPGFSVGLGPLQALGDLFANLTLRASNETSQLFNASGAFVVNTQGLVLPRVSTTTLGAAAAGTITYSGGKAYLYDGSGWSPIGSGGSNTWGNGIIPTRTETKNDAGYATSTAPQVSGFYETSNPVNFPTGASNWWNLLNVAHSNNNNNYAMQIAGSFFDQDLYFRKTNNSATQAWSKFVVQNPEGNVGINKAADSAYGLDVNGKINATGLYVNGVPFNSGTTYPLSLPSANSFDLKSSADSWTGFDLSGGNSKRIILGVDQARSTTSPVLSVEDTTGWEHRFNLWANGSASFKSDVQAAQFRSNGGRFYTIAGDYDPYYFIQATAWDSGLNFQQFAGGFNFKSGTYNTVASISDKGSGFFSGNLGVGTTSPSQKLSVYNGNIVLLREQGTSITPGAGPQIILESPSAAVTTQETSRAQCGGAGQSVCPADNTPPVNSNDFYVCPAGSGGASYTQDVGHIVGDTQYYVRGIICVSGTAQYSMRANDGTLEFLNGTGVRGFWVDQNAVANATTFQASSRVNIGGVFPGDYLPGISLVSRDATATNGHFWNIYTAPASSSIIDPNSFQIWEYGQKNDSCTTGGICNPRFQILTGGKTILVPSGGQVDIGTATAPGNLLVNGTTTATNVVAEGVTATNIIGTSLVKAEKLNLGGLRGGVNIQVTSAYAELEIQPDGNPSCNAGGDVMCARACPLFGGGALGRFVKSRGGGQCGIWTCGCYGLTGVSGGR